MYLTEALGLPLAQSEVDFVIPDLDRDRRLCIDPFLLFKSKEPRLQALHDRLITVFNTAFRSYRDGDRQEMDRLIDFPEVNNIGLGYSERNSRGSGMGPHLNRLVADTLAASPSLQERGVRHIEELQLISVGIGHDRISDMTANILKAELVAYTQEQCALWDIPIERGVPLAHLFDLNSFSWYDEYVDLPVNPNTGVPILLVPRRIVRTLPWINFDDYERTEFRYYLRSQRPITPNRRRPTKRPKAEVVEVSRQTLRLIEDYVRRKEAEADQLAPTLGPVTGGVVQREADALIATLEAIPPGTKDATAYQRHTLAILNFLFEPSLTNGKLEEPTRDGTERRDMIFTNEADASFWAYVRGEYSGLLVMFETKNVQELDNGHINQVATYLGDRIGRLGFIVTRNPAAEPQQRKIASVFNNGSPRKVILVLHDEDMKAMIRMRARGENPKNYVQSLYRAFKISLQ